MSGRLVRALLPERLGPGFRRLLASSWVSNLGDGLALAAGPLLVASLTTDARLVALAATVQWIPPLAFGLAAGVVTDRVDRRRVVVAVNLARAVVLGALTWAVAVGEAPIPLVLAALFVLGTAEVFADNAAQTFLPMLVAREDLALGNARLQTGFVVLNQMAGPPLGAALFALGAAVPFGAQSALVLLAAGVVAKVRLPVPTRTTARRHPWHDVAEGMRWVRRHAAVRTLVLTIFTFNITFGAAWSVLVLYSSERLGLGDVGFGLITAVSALGGLLGTACYGWLTRRMALATIMRAGLVLETLTHLALALTTSAAVAMAIFFVFGAHAFVWNTTSVTVRQRAVPTPLQGRVGSVNLVGVFGGLVLGSLIGGALAGRWGVTAPFWFAFAGSAVFLLLIWREQRHIAHADAGPAPADG